MPTPEDIDSQLFETLWEVRKRLPSDPELDRAVVWARQIKARHAIGATMRRCGVGSPRHVAVEEAERESLEYVTAAVAGGRATH